MLSCERRSWLLPRGLRRLSGPGKKFVEIDRSVFEGVLEAESDLCVAEAGLWRDAVGGRAGVAQRGFYFRAKFTSDAIEIAGDAGFVFAEGAADLGESLLLGVVEAETLSVARIKGGEGAVKCGGEKSEVARAMRVGWRIAEGGDGMDLRGMLRGAVAVIEFGEAAIGADGVDVALGEDGAEPSLERAATVEIAEERRG